MRETHMNRLLHTLALVGRIPAIKPREPGLPTEPEMPNEVEELSLSIAAAAGPKPDGDDVNDEDIKYC
jgi:hypothetical protein